MRVAFTGTRTLVAQDTRVIEQRIGALPLDVEVFTGGCIGLDALAARIASRMGAYVTVVLPAKRDKVDPSWRLFARAVIECPNGRYPYRIRNAALVAGKDLVIAFPRHEEHDPRSRHSGTWMTVRLAQKAGIPTEVHVLGEVD